ncbi:unnamed protein product [Phaeothamnion confervicola]
MSDGDSAVPAGVGRVVMGSTFALAVGFMSLAVVLINRLAFTAALYDSQARSDILAVVSAAGIVLNGVYLLDLAVRRAETVKLVGTFCEEMDPTLPAAAQRRARWLCEALLRASPATSVVILSGVDGAAPVAADPTVTMAVGAPGCPVAVVARYGVVGPAPPSVGTIVAKAVREGAADGRETYLPAVQQLPGKVEFAYLPENCQGVLVLPLPEDLPGGLSGDPPGGSVAVVILGTNRARAFTPRDIAWAKGLCQRAAAQLTQG